ARVRKQGYALVREEHTLGISAIGAVISDGQGAVAAVSVPVPTQRLEGREKQLVTAMIATCRQISSVLSG
ncbi:MAG: IclR family transcriptional regulator C-terminal domain-containing protein, partial [Solirubrobacteraceae bacterium]